jgi:hypothetical protein
MNPYLILAVVIAFVLSNAFSFVKGDKYRDTIWVAKVQQERADGEAAALKKEKELQGAADAISAKQDQKLRSTQRNLTVALDSLRDHPMRPSGHTEAPRVECPCSTGAGLCKQDAEFLTREAARSDDIRSGLETCYTFIDSVK